MSINSALNNAYSGLSATGRMAEIAANNIANALNDDYNRRSVELASSITAGRGSGVEVAGINRAVDANLVRDLRGAEGRLANAGIAEGAASTIASAIGGPDDLDSLFALYEDFETALEAVADTPESQASQQRVAVAASAITTKFNDLSATAALLRTDADNQIAREIEKLNGNLGEVEAINREIELAVVSGRDATALLDQREKLLDEISRIIPIKEVPTENGKVDILGENGVFLLNGQAKEVSFTAAGQVVQGQTLANGALSGLSVGDIDITPGSGVLGVEGGSIGALFKVRDETGVEFADQVDALARDLVERFQSPAVDPTLVAGDAGLFTDFGAAFDPANQEGLASRIAVNDAIDPAAGGEYRRIRDGINSVAPGETGSDVIVRNLIDAFRDPAAPPAETGVFGAFSANDLVASFTSLKTTEQRGAETAATALQSRVQSLSDAERTFSGVDTDAETAQLILIEQSYAANARVIEVIDQLIQRLLEI
ncbi:MAG: flagellar hook-associated protein FlgK [Pseudomonadota bacterium]